MEKGLVKFQTSFPIRKLRKEIGPPLTSNFLEFEEEILVNFKKLSECNICCFFPFFLFIFLFVCSVFVCHKAETYSSFSVATIIVYSTVY